MRTMRSFFTYFSQIVSASSSSSKTEIHSFSLGRFIHWGSVRYSRRMHGLFFEVIAKAEVTQASSKKVWCRRVRPTLSMSLVRMHSGRSWRG